MKKRTKKKVFDLPVPAPVKSPEQELPDYLEIVCPSCSTHLANARIRFGRPLKKSDFSVRDDLKAEIKYQKNKLPVCPLCQFKFTPQAIYGFMMAALARRKMEGKTWNKTRYQRPELP